ncbi:MAG TPA: hypothetical protein VKA94_15640 [Hyphomicrobiales bacterium]|nr:hypothetical protein [Hyphomicrobiales bacterium]
MKNTYDGGYLTHSVNDARNCRKNGCLTLILHEECHIAMAHGAVIKKL